jgi:parvulin-like peptidyl-prolyl isomerase
MAFSFFRRLPANPITSKAALAVPAALFLSVALLATGCHPAVKDPNDPKFVVAEKGNWQITRGDLDKEIGSYLQQHQMTMDQVGPANRPKLETFMLDNMVLKKLILDHAASLQLKDVDQDVTKQLDTIKGRVPPGEKLEDKLKEVGLTEDELKQRIHDQVVISKVMDIEAFKDSTPSEQEVSDFYMKNKEKFDIPPQVRASRVLILVDEKATPAEKAAKKKAIDKAHDRVVKGEEFSKVATEVSEDKYSAPRGGDINWFRKGENEEQFDAVAFSTKTGAVSAVFETPMGYQFIKVTDAHPGGIASLADASATISKYLSEMKKRQQEAAYTDKLLADSGVTYHITRVDLKAPAPPAAGASPDAQAAPAPDAQAAPAPAPDAGTPAPAAASAPTSAAAPATPPTK